MTPPETAATLNFSVACFVQTVLLPFQPEPGMPVWSVSEPDISLHVFDTPVSYTTSLGQPMSFSVEYDQRDARITNACVPVSGWKNTWSSYVHVFGNVDTNGNVDFTKWTGYLYPRVGGLSIFDFVNRVNPDTSDVMTPLNSSGPVGNGTNYGANGFRVASNDGGVDIYGLVTPAYSTEDANGLNCVDHLVRSGGLPTGLSAASYLGKLNMLAGGWSYNVPFTGEDDSGDANSGGNSNPGVTGTMNPPNSLPNYGPGGGKGWGGQGIAVYPKVACEADALLTEHIDRFGNSTRYYYMTTITSSGSTNFLLQFVVDCDGKTNTITYDGAGLVSTVTSPYGQSAHFYYSGNQLTSITDAQGMTSSMIYCNNNGYLSALTTPYGQTEFSIWDQGSVYQRGYEFGAAEGTNLISRAILVTRPNYSQDLYLYRYDSSGIGVLNTFSSSSAPAATPIGTIDDGSTFGLDSDAGFNLRNSFHWGPQQCAVLSTTTALDQLTAHDYLLATMSHWLAGRSTGAEAGGTISAIQEGSADGVNAGPVTWFDYGSKATPYQLGTAPMSEELAAQVQPDGSTRYTDVKLTSGLPASVTSTYSLPDGTVGTRTISADYTNLEVNQVFTSGSGTVSSGSWTFPELLDITWPGEHQLLFTGEYSVQTITETNYGVVSTTQIPERPLVVTVDAVLDNTLTYYNSRGQVTSRYAAGLTTTNQFDRNGFPAKSVALEIQRTNQYSFVNGQLASATSPLGLTTQYSWDNLGRLTGISYPDHTSISNVYTSLDLTDQKDRMGSWQHSVYDSERHRTSFTDRNGNPTGFSYCLCGGLESVTDPLNGTTIYDRDLNGRVTNITDEASGRSYGLNRDVLGRVVNLTDTADGTGTGLNYAYNHQGLLTDVFYEEDLPIYHGAYDIYDRLVSTVDANNITVNSTFDAIGRVLTRAYPNGATETNFYSVWGVSKHTDLNGQATTYGYDPAARITSVTNANLEVTRFRYDAAGDLLTLTDGRGNTTGWNYDQYGRALAKTNANQVVVWTNGYNANGWLVNFWTPAKGLAALGYDANGNATSLILPGISIARAFDALNRPTQIDDGNIRLKFNYTSFGAFKGALSSETSQPIAGALDVNDTLRGVAYGYNYELPVSQTRADQTIAYAYDILGRLRSVTTAAGAFNYSYNNAGNLVQNISIPGNDILLYDSMGNLTNLSININAEQSSLAYAYDLNGNRQQVWRGINFTYDSSVSYGYDAVGQLTSAVGHEASGGTRLGEQFGYGYDKAGNLVARTNGVLAQAFVADPANELTNVTRNGSLTFAGSASTTLTSVTVNNQTTAVYQDQTFATTAGLPLVNGTNTFTVVATDPGGDSVTNVYTAKLPAASRLCYDANGNLTSDGLRGFDYDGLNELVRVTTTNVWKTEYDYDGLGRHHARREYAWQTGNGWFLVNECYYVYARQDVVQEVNTVEGTASYTYGLGLLERDTTVANQPAVFYHTDANGNAVLLYDISGQMQADYVYDPYGNLVAKSGGMADVNRYRFSGKEFNPHTGLYYYGYRFYDPNLQRWLNQDPLADPSFGLLHRAASRKGRSFAQRPVELTEGPNLYEFVGNNPINKIDPMGLSWLGDFWNWLMGSPNLNADPSQAGSEEQYWANQAGMDSQLDSVTAPGYAAYQRQQLQNVGNFLPSDIYVFAGVGKEVHGNGGEALCLMGGNMRTGQTYWGGLAAGSLGVLPGENTLGGGAEWTSSAGWNPIFLYDSGVGPGGYYVPNEGYGAFMATPTPIFVGIGYGWSN